MRFLETALRALADNAPDAVRSNFAPPNAEALKQQLPRLREFYIPMATEELAKLKGNNRLYLNAR